MANSDKNIVITPNTGTSSYPSIAFTGSNASPITLKVLDTGALSFSATAGQLFTIQDGLTGSLFAVADISGIPLIEVMDTSIVKLNQYGGSSVIAGSVALQNSGGVNSKLSIYTNTATTTGLIVKAATSQTATLTEWQNSSGAAVTRISSDGTIAIHGPSNTNLISFVNSTGNYGVGGITSSGVVATNGAAFGYTYSQFGATVGIRPGISTTANIALVIRGETSQTGDLQQWQNSAGTVISKVDAGGIITATAIYASTLNAATVNLSSQVVTTYEGRFGGAPALGVVTAGTWTTSIPLFVARASSGQTASLQEWQNSAGTALAKIQADGSVGVNGTPGTNTKFYIEESYTGNGGANTGLRVRGTGSSSSNWKGRIIAGGDTVAFLMGEYNSQAWLGGHNAALNAWASFYINPDGLENVYLGNTGSAGSTPIVTIKNANGFVGIGTSSATAKLHIINTSASAQGLIVKAAASQTANLQEWQDSSGNILANLTSTGRLRVTAEVIGIGSYLAVGSNGGSTEAVYLGYNYDYNIGSGGIIFNRPVRPASTSAAGSVIRGLASQSGNLQEWQDSTGAVIAKVDPVGGFTTGTPSTTNIKLDATAAGAKLHFGIPATVNNYATLGAYSSVFNIEANARSILATVTNSTTTTTLIVKANTSQTANLQEWQSSTGSVGAYVASDGSFITRGSLIGGSYSGSALFGVQNYSTTQVVAVVKGAASQTADLQQWQDSSGTNLLRLNSVGKLLFGSGSSGTNFGTSIIFDQVSGINSPDGITWNFTTTNTVSAQVLAVRTAASYATDLYFTTANPADQIASEKMRISSTGTVTINGFTSAAQGLIVKGAASQTANLLEYRNSANSLLGFTRWDGAIGIPGIRDVAQSGPYIDFSSTTITLNTRNTTSVGLIVKAAASQTANLQEWQNSSSTVLAKVDKDGNINTTKSFVQTGTIGTTYAIDASGNQEAYAANATVDFPNFSGMILIDCQTDGALSLWLCGGAAATRIGGSKTGGYDGNVAYNSGINGYTWTNANTSQNVNITAIRARSGA